VTRDRDLNLLAFDTSTENLTVAVLHGGASLFEGEAPGGAQASATLLPLVHRLLERAGVPLATVDAIAFGRGPGSFTGLRTACSVAQGLAFGAGVPVLPVDTLLAVAEEARGTAGVTRVVAVLDARMGEVYCGRYAFADGAWSTHEAPRLSNPEDVVVPEGWALAGNAFAAHAGRLPAAAQCVTALPTAAALARLAPALLDAGQGVAAEHALPLYIRDKVAQTTQEREAARDARAARKPTP
jgi:tRNA threonylcarbamoyladenosine biosynthesis protein TsaB